MVFKCIAWNVECKVQRVQRKVISGIYIHLLSFWPLPFVSSYLCARLNNSCWFVGSIKFRGRYLGPQDLKFFDLVNISVHTCIGMYIQC